MTASSSDALTDPGLSRKAYLGFAAAFLFLPGACVLLSSFLYRWWQTKYPVCAKQINRLGFAIFGVQLLLWFFLWRSEQAPPPQVPTAPVSSVTPLVSPQAAVATPTPTSKGDRDGE